MTRQENIAALIRSLDDAGKHGKSLHGVVDLWLAHHGTERLRSLIKAGEFGGSHNIGRCPWCGASVERGDAHLTIEAAREAHIPLDLPQQCPAFTAAGVVR